MNLDLLLESERNTGFSVELPTAGTLFYRSDGSLYSVAFTVTSEGLKFEGTPSKVDPAHESISGDDVETEELVPLREAAVGPDGSALLKLISPGQGSSGYYSKEVLQDAAANRVFPKGLKMFMDHQTEEEERSRPEGSLTNLMGVLEGDAEYQENGPDGPGLYAPVRVYSDFIKFVNERYKDIGNSIRALGVKVMGQVAGKPTAIIKKLAAAKSVDFVTTAGAGGKLVPLYESFRSGSNRNDGLESNRNAAKSRNSNEESTMTEKEAQELRDKLAALEKQNVALREAAVKSTASELLVDRLAASTTKLPDRAKQRIKERLLPRTGIEGLPLTEAGVLDEDKFKAQIDAAIKDEDEYLKEAAPSGIKNMGDGGDARDDLKEAAQTFQSAVNFLAGIQKEGK